MAAKLKVFQTVIGLRTWVVAATSRKEALKAWDVRRDLFAAGEAGETNEPAAITLAFKSPGVAVPYKAVPAGAIDNALKGEGPARRVTRKPAKPPPKKDRSRLDEAEKALAQFRKQAASRRQAIADERDDAEAAWTAELKKLGHQEAALLARVKRETEAFED